MTVSDIAKLAKVSTATVSRTINRVPTVDPVLARRVWRVIDRVGYFPNTHARTLVCGRSRIFGLMVSDTIISCFPDMVQRFADLGAEHGYEILLSPLPRDWGRLDVIARRFIGRRVDGVAILTFTQENSLVSVFRRNEVPVFALAFGSADKQSNTLRVDYERGVRQAVQHLAALGHTHFCFICGTSNFTAAMERKTAFENCVKEIGTELSQVSFLNGDDTMEGGMKVMSALASLDIRPSAVVCSNDLTAIGVMREALLRGIDIPRHLSVIGIDDITVARLVTPSLTTVHISQLKIAEIAFRVLRHLTEARHEGSAREQYMVETKLVLRGSTAIGPSRLGVPIEERPTTQQMDERLSSYL